MTYDEALAARVRRALGSRADIDERKMFGGLAFLVGGKMFCGVVDRDLMVRVGPDRYAAALDEPHVRPMDFTGRPMVGYVYVAAAGVRTTAAVAAWARRGLKQVARMRRGR
jgi:TfoX/Sxy family transcriptional regulator of competence genes